MSLLGFSSTRLGLCAVCGQRTPEKTPVDLVQLELRTCSNNSYSVPLSHITIAVFEVCRLSDRGGGGNVCVATRPSLWILAKCFLFYTPSTLKNQAEFSVVSSCILALSPVTTNRLLGASLRWATGSDDK